MLTITIHVDAPAGQAIGVKEAIAQDLEKYGDVRVVSVEERGGEQIDLWKGRQNHGVQIHCKCGV